jgi:hypothetical protein
VAPELEQIRHEVEEITSGWSGVEWCQAPPGKWNSAQILEHLLLTYTGTSKGLRLVLDGARSLPGAPRLAHRIRTLVVTKLGWMPLGREAFRQILPDRGLRPESMRRFYDALVAMDATLNDAERRFGKRVKVLDHPFLGPLDAQEWRLFHRTHTRHHLKQVVERVRHVTPLAGTQTPA